MLVVPQNYYLCSQFETCCQFLCVFSHRLCFVIFSTYCTFLLLLLLFLFHLKNRSVCIFLLRFFGVWWGGGGNGERRKKTKRKEEQQQQTLSPLTFNCKITIMSLKYTPVTQSILCLISLMCAATTHHQTTVDKNMKTICSI